MKQVDKEAYRFDTYVGIDRWSSYYYQLQEILLCKPKSMLEVGVGDQVVGRCVKAQGIAYTSVDVAEDLSPDFVADVTALPFREDSFDVVCAFEVLEHLPYEKFTVALGELARVSKDFILISLPHFGPSIRGELKVPFLPRFRFAIKLPFPRKHVFNGEHYWEIGKKGYPVRRILDDLRKVGDVCEEFIPFESQYHHFFVIKKNTKASHAS